MSSSEKIDLYSAAGVYLSEAQNPIPPTYTLHTYVQTVYLFTQGGGEGRVEPEIRGEEQHRRDILHCLV
jgi:hypothetical protein